MDAGDSRQIISTLKLVFVKEDVEKKIYEVAGRVSHTCYRAYILMRKESSRRLKGRSLPESRRPILSIADLGSPHEASRGSCLPTS